MIKAGVLWTCVQKRAARVYIGYIRRANLQRFKEAKSLFRKTIPVARRVLGEGHQFTLLMRRNYSLLLCDDGSTLDDLREAVATLEDAERIARRVLGSAHPDVAGIEEPLQDARAALRARETPPPGSA